MFYHNIKNKNSSKILIATLPLSGHVNAFIPIVKELFHRNHEIVWYSGKKFQETIEKTGVTFKPFVSAKDWDEKKINEYFPKLNKLKGYKQANYYLKNVFLNQMENQYNDLLEILKTFDADILFTDLEFTGAVPIAEKKILPWIILCVHSIIYFTKEIIPNVGPAYSKYHKGQNKIINSFLQNVIFNYFNNTQNRMREKVGLLPVKKFIFNHSLDLSKLFMTLSVKSLEYNREDLPKHTKFIGPAKKSVSGNANLYKPEFNNQNNHTVLVTQGTLDCYNINKLIIPTLKALINKKLNIIVIANKTKHNIIKNQFPSENLIIKNYISYEEIMPHIDILISNGGFGGVITALSHGIPIITAGNTEDKPELASRIAWTGSGINLKTGNPKPRKIEKAVNKILTNPKYKKNAFLLKEEISKTNAPIAAANYIDTVLKEKENI